MSHAMPSGPVFQIDDDDDDLADSDQNTLPAFTEPAEQRQKLLVDDATTTADRIAGTVGCCGAFCMLFGCISCGMCWREFRDTYIHHTLCGRWCPV
jgi:hypothetical protein